MSHAPRRVVAAVLVISAASLIVSAAPAPADAVYMKDGFTLHGKVRREADLMTDPLTGLTIPIIKGSNFFIVDDRVRWVIFGHRSVQDADPQVNIRSDFIELSNPLPGSRPQALPKAARLENITQFDPKWQRNTFLRNELGKFTIKQRLTSLTPYAARVEANTYQWTTYYLTKEFGLDAVKKLLETAPDLKEEKGPDVDVRLKRFHFILQAGWLIAAEEELEKARKDLPKDDKDITERLDRARKLLRVSQVRDLWEDIQTAHRAGRYKYVQAILTRLPMNELDARVATEAGTLKAKYDAWDKQVADVRHLLDFADGQIVGPSRPAFAAAETEIRSLAGPDTIDRLEPFLTIAGQYERDVKAGKPPTYTSESVIAVAVTGWVMAMPAAEPTVATAEKFWASREFVQTHQRTHDAGNRRRLFDAYQQQSPLSLDEITQLITMLPPTETPAPGTTVAPGVEERTTQVPWTQNRPVSYVLQLPPEYRPSRSYPVLIVLRAGGERPIDALARWAPEGARQGYILAAPDWGGAGGYNYSTDEHNSVTELVKDLRRKYAVDSDRVFLTGYGDGGTMAFDVALSHPDLFAGVVPINGRPKVSTIAWYWRNAQYLPFYIVAGELAGDIVSMNRVPFENWMSKGFPSLMTIYKGRPMEQFVAEIPFIYDWMNRKKRASGFPELGRNPSSGSLSEEFQTMRPGDNHFYWVSVEQIHEKYVNNEVGMKRGSAAALQAQVRDGNQVFVNTRGIKSLRVWFGRIWDPQSGWRPMIDFAKPVNITANTRIAGARNQMVQPSLRTMLDDLYQRGDRQRMFLAFVDLTNLQ
jgi:pimeloyl-ACP methyl ester carboxylesterase